MTHHFSAIRPTTKPALWVGLCVAAIVFAGMAHAQDGADSTEIPADASALAAQQNVGPVTNLKLPRFVSLKGSNGNARRGPSLSHRVDWVFKHAGMPLRVTAEFGNWRRIEDRDGAGGWVHYILLSGVRTVVFNDDNTTVHARPDANAPAVATARAGAIAKLEKCTVDWCEVTAERVDGWVPKTAVWGVDPDETRD